MLFVLFTQHDLNMDPEKCSMGFRVVGIVGRFFFYLKLPNSFTDAAQPPNPQR